MLMELLLGTPTLPQDMKHHRPIQDLGNIFRKSVPKHVSMHLVSIRPAVTVELDIDGHPGVDELRAEFSHEFRLDEVV